MPNIAKSLYRDNAPTSSTTLYTVPSLTSTVITDMFLVNTGSSENSITINFNGKAIIPTTHIAGNSVVNFSMKQVLAAGQTITANASSSSIIIHLSGMEIS